MSKQKNKKNKLHQQPKKCYLFYLDSHTHNGVTDQNICSIKWYNSNICKPRRLFYIPPGNTGQAETHHSSINFAYKKEKMVRYFYLKRSFNKICKCGISFGVFEVSYGENMLSYLVLKI